jgi:hypothetical protein
MSQDYMIEEQSLSRPQVVQWAVGSLIFLRFLIPLFILPMGLEAESQETKKAAILIGRFMMKLCCKTHFAENETCLMNEAIDELSSTFDQFCGDVVGIGSKNSSEDSLLVDFIKQCCLERDFNTWKSDLFDLIMMDFKLISDTIQKCYKHIPEDGSKSSYLLLNQFKKELSASVSETNRLTADVSQSVSSFLPSSSSAGHLGK